jgi:quinol monooxygenase YgiN
LDKFLKNDDCLAAAKSFRRHPSQRGETAMSRTGLIINFTAKKGMREQLAQHLLQATQSYLAETGTELFTINLSTENPDDLIVVETYRDETAKAAHEAATGYAAIRAKTGTFLAGPPRVTPTIPLGGKGL